MRVLACAKHFIKQLEVMKLAFRLMEMEIDNNRKLALSNVARKRIAEALR